MKSKLRLAILCIVITSAIFAGCRKEEKPDQSLDELAGSIVVWSSGETAQLLENGVKYFTAAHSASVIEVKNMSRDELYSKLVSATASGQELPDMATVESEYIPSLVYSNQKALLDLTGEVNNFKDKMIKVKLADISVVGKYYALPWVTSPVLFYYRIDLLEQQGISAEDIKTWNDFIDAGKKLSVNTEGKVKMLAFDKGSDQLFRIMLRQLSGGYFDKEGKTTLSSPSSQRVMSVIKKMHDSGILLELEGEKMANLSGTNGNTASAIAGTEQFAAIRKSDEKALGRWSAGNLPAFEPGGKTASFTEDVSIIISANTKSQKLSKEFLKFLVSNKETVSFGVSEKGLLPISTEYYGDPVFDRRIPEIENKRVLRILGESARDASEVFSSLDISEVRKTVRKVQYEILYNNAELRGTMEALDKQIKSRVMK